MASPILGSLIKFPDLPRFVYSNSEPDAVLQEFVGLEIEMENFKGCKGGEDLYGIWDFTDDGSLRNHGKEAVSWPMSIGSVPYALKTLYNELVAAPDFSGRTSVHVHMNMQDMTIHQIEALTILYCIFEKSLYEFAGPKRWNSIFCVPITETSTLLSNFFSNPQFKYIPNYWMKYSGFNLVPLLDKGTIEFRQMVGNLDVNYIYKWVNILASLKKYILKQDLSDLNKWIEDMFTLTSSSKYEQLARDVFGSFYYDLTFNLKDLDNALKFVKANIIKGWDTKKYVVEEGSPYRKLCLKSNKELIDIPLTITFDN